MKRDKQQYKVKINMKQPHTNNKKQKYKQLNRKKEKKNYGKKDEIAPPKFIKKEGVKMWKPRISCPCSFQEKSLSL